MSPKLSSACVRCLPCTCRSISTKINLQPPKKSQAAVSPQQVDRAYNLLARPPLASYTTLSNRIQGANTIDLSLLEQSCVCPSFWAEYNHAKASWLKAWKADNDSVSNAKLTHFCDTEQLNNARLALLGNDILGMIATEWLERKWPHLPIQALKAALSMFVGTQTCADVARGWGITSGTALQHISPHEPGHPGKPSRGINEGRKAGTGVLRWSRSTKAILTSSPDEKELQEYRGDAFATAMASSSRAIVGALFQTSGFEATRSFIQSHFLSRLTDLNQILKFTNPKTTLFKTMEKYALGGADLRLTKESGRATHAPIFVVAVFSKDASQRKLGEGMGSSIKMAEFRACEDALRRIYLASKHVADSERMRLPSDTFCGGEWSATERQDWFGDDEVEFGSGKASGKLATGFHKQPWEEMDRVSAIVQK